MKKEPLAAALDEIYWLRMQMASEARIIEAHLELKSFPKSRRQFALEQVDRLRRSALGGVQKVISDSRTFDRARREMRSIGGKETLTMSQWLAEQEPPGASSEES